MSERYPRPWSASQDRDKPTMMDFGNEPAELERMNVHDAAGNYLFTVAGKDKARDLLLIVNGDLGPFDIDYTFSPAKLPR